MTRARKASTRKSAQRPIEVAVIGGGCASLTAAFELTRPEHNGRYSVTVYQMGWRLGGKGASGRGVADRVEEHGLHLWMGFYENAFRIMRECYDELPPDEGRRFKSWQDAFSPARDVAVADVDGDDWSFWIAHFPPGRGLPGDPLESASPFSIPGYLRQSAMLVAELLRSAESQGSESGKAARALRYGQLATAAAVFEAGDTLVQAMTTWLPQSSTGDANPMLRLVDAIAATAKRILEELVADDIGLRRVWQVIDVILASMRGAMLNGLALDPRGFDALNEYDWREWLSMNGASQQSLDSGFMRAIYDLCFAFEDGDVTRPRLAAGVAMRGAVRMFFTYRGSLFWRMNAGMGDVVFAPLYEVLRKRGVKFEFFHRLHDITLSPDTNSIDALVFDVQARTKDGNEYSPLVDVRGVPSWPALPDYAQLEDGGSKEAAFEMHWDETSVARKKLEAGRDFDLVVLGVSVGVLPFVARELIERSPRWRDMVDHVRTVPTQALQLWLREDVRSLGWNHPPVNLSGFVEPFDTWADMAHLIPEESWTEPVKAIAYFCSVLPDTGPARVTRAFWQSQRAIVRRNAAAFMNNDLRRLWPRAADDRGFHWELLAIEGDGRQRGSRRLDSQYWTANVNPTDRYVLSLPGTIKYRVSPLDLTFDNLTIAGDWTATGLDSGCIESAMISGRLAAHAISRHPPLHDIVGYDHP